MPGVSIVGLFLLHVKAAVTAGNVQFVPRKASQDFLAERGMSVYELWDRVLELDASDCFDGPEPDRDPRWSEEWTVAEFSPEWDGETVYLKLSVCTEGPLCKALSVKLYTERDA